MTPRLFCFLCQVDLEEESRKKRVAALTLCQKIVLYSLRVFMGLVSFGLIIAAFYGIFEATVFSQVNYVKRQCWCRCGLGSERLGWTFGSHLCQTEKYWEGRDPGFDFWVSTVHRHHHWKLPGAAAVWPDHLDRAICPKHYCHCGTIEVSSGVSVRERLCQSICI